MTSTVLHYVYLLESSLASLLKRNAIPPPHMSNVIAKLPFVPSLWKFPPPASLS